MPNQETNFIPGIYNYCDAWCERCTFTARCRTADKLSDLTDEESDINNEAFWHRLAANFAEAKQMLIEKAEEFDIDINAVSDEEFAAIRKRQDEFIENDELTILAMKYAKEAGTVLENLDDWLIFAAPEEEIQNEMLDIIVWYQHFIAVKTQRGLYGLLDFDGNFDEEELENVQSDANGSIKITLIAVDRSILAWTALMSDENATTIKPLLRLLQTIREKTEKKFPNAYNFMRPGFDKIEIVM